MFPRRFALVRHVDYTGISGVGVVAYGVVFADGHVALRWCSDYPATSLWASIDDLIAVHGHGDGTSVQWIDSASDRLQDAWDSLDTPRGRRRRKAEPTVDVPTQPRGPAEPQPEATEEHTPAEPPTHEADVENTPPEPPPPPEPPSTGRPAEPPVLTPQSARAAEHAAPADDRTRTSQAADAEPAPAADRMASDDPMVPAPRRGGGRHRRAVPAEESAAPR
ncbi:hypothetical protein [Phytoactinopolyspora endophytica]|uniref:hypothetical protein n=1 Tax=Phytoactinopolyspora endophytica TaxID=1642495 RepID=UPI00197BED89|nr:hypothetical protein [Phytoactinopolyspora endophytica]